MIETMLALAAEFWPVIAGALGVISVFIAGWRGGQAKVRTRHLERERDMAIARERARREAESWDDDEVVDLLTGKRRKR